VVEVPNGKGRGTTPSSKGLEGVGWQAGLVKTDCGKTSKKNLWSQPHGIERALQHWSEKDRRGTVNGGRKSTLTCTKSR